MDDSRSRSRRRLRLWQLVVHHHLKLFNQLSFLLFVDHQRAFDNRQDETRLVCQTLKFRLGNFDKHLTSLFVRLQSQRHERFHDVLRRIVLGDDRVLVERVHVGARNFRRQLELLHDAFLFSLGQVRRRHGYDKVHGSVRVILLVISNEWSFLVLWRDEFFQELLVVLRPRAQRQLGDFQRAFVSDMIQTSGDESSLALEYFFGDFTFKVPVPWHHLLWLFIVQNRANVIDNISRIVVWNRSGPSRPDTFGAVNQNSWNNRHVIRRFNLLTIFIVVFQQSVVAFREYNSGQLRQTRKNVTRRRMVLPALQTRTKLTARD